MEQLLEEAYEKYVAKREGSTKQRKRLKQKHSEDDELLEVWFFCPLPSLSKLLLYIFILIAFMALPFYVFAKIAVVRGIQVKVRNRLGYSKLSLCNAKG